MHKQKIMLYKLSLLCLLSCCSITVWAKLFGQALCHFPGFHCLKVKPGQSWVSLFPNEHDRTLVKRINRINTQVWVGMILAVPETLENLNIAAFSPFDLQITPPEEKVIYIDPVYQAWAAYDAEGRLIRWGPASSGADFCKDVNEVCQTHAGVFRIFSLGSSDCYSTKFPLPFGGAPMPYCMYFNNGQAIHGEPNGLPGYNASHGCVRLFVNDAEWLRYDFAEGPDENNHFRGTKIIVKPYTDTFVESEQTLS